jgi:hypothetical protein
MDAERSMLRSSQMAIQVAGVAIEWSMGGAMW